MRELICLDLINKKRGIKNLSYNSEDTYWEGKERKYVHYYI